MTFLYQYSCMGASGCPSNPKYPFKMWSNRSLVNVFAPSYNLLKLRTLMSKKKLKPGRKKKQIELKDIRYWSDFQLDWEKLIPRLKRFSIKTVDFLSIAGDAPKDFITDSEYRPGHRTRQQRSESYIAKVGSKFYPNESIIEQLITRIGEVYAVKIAESKLRVVGPQVRFISKYFLNRRIDQLTHGAEIYRIVSLAKRTMPRLPRTGASAIFSPSK